MTGQVKYAEMSFERVWESGGLASEDVLAAITVGKIDRRRPRSDR